MESGDFICPICGKELLIEGRSLVCEGRHCFDIAKSGYVNLLPANHKNSLFPGDNKEMIKARVRVMEKGYYARLADRIIEVLRELSPIAVLDAGCGTGYIPGRIKQEYEEIPVYGTDISKFAIEQASKLIKRVNFAVGSSMRLPIKDKSVSAVICAFAPVYANEFNRVTVDKGLLLRVVPAKAHLYDLKEFIYDEPRYNIEDETEFDGYEAVSVEQIKSTFTGNREDINSLVKMTPYYYHTSKDKLGKLDEIRNLTVSTEFELRIFRKI